MTRIVVILLVLYVVWRVASILGRRREREYRADQESRRSGGVVLPMAKCSRCGRYLSAGEVRWEGRWPNRRAMCAGGCPDHGDEQSG